MSETFAHGAGKLAGTVCRLLGWHPSDFWDATPAEIATIFTGEEADHDHALSRAEFETLLKREGNG